MDTLRKHAVFFLIGNISVTSSPRVLPPPPDEKCRPDPDGNAAAVPRQRTPDLNRPMSLVTHLNAVHGVRTVVAADVPAANQHGKNVVTLFGLHPSEYNEVGNGKINNSSIS
jgi:hypothetical protein